MRRAALPCPPAREPLPEGGAGGAGGGGDAPDDNDNTRAHTHTHAHTNGLNDKEKDL